MSSQEAFHVENSVDVYNVTDFKSSNGRTIIAYIRVGDETSTPDFEKVFSEEVRENYPSYFRPPTIRR